MPPAIPRIKRAFSHFDLFPNSSGPRSAPWLCGFDRSAPDVLEDAGPLSDRSFRIPDSQDHPELVTILDAVIDGRLSAKDAGCGTPLALQVAFEIAENLGRLSRGRPAEFTPQQAGLLHGLIDSAVDLVFSGKAPANTMEEIALRLMDLAFDLDDPVSCRTRKGARWGIGQLHKLLTSPTYKGEYVFNRKVWKTKEESRTRNG